MREGCIFNCSHVREMSEKVEKVEVTIAGLRGIIITPLAESIVR